MVNKQILRLALPSILANITIPLVGLVDTAIVGHLSDASSIGGIAIGTMLFDLLYWNFGFLRVGTSGMTAQAFGRGDRADCTRLLAQALSIAFLSSILLWAIQWLFVTAVLAITPCSSAVAEFARQYFFIRIWAAPATLALMAFKGWFIGMQDTVSAMVCDIVVNVVNMAASYYLAVYTSLGAIGVAHGTLVAQYTGLIVAFLLYFLRYASAYRLTLLTREQLRGMRAFLTLNANIFVRSLCFMVVYVGYTAIAGKYGDIDLAISSILMKYFMIFSYFIDGFAYAGEALVGKTIGEHSSTPHTIHSTPYNLRQLVRALLLWALGLGVVFSALYAVLGIDGVGLLTNDADILAVAHSYMGWMIAMPIVSTLAFMWDGVFVGATDGVGIRNAMIWAAAGFVLAYCLLYRLCGIQALYIAYFVHLIARVLYLTIRWRLKYRIVQ